MVKPQPDLALMKTAGSTNTLVRDGMMSTMNTELSPTKCAGNGIRPATNRAFRNSLPLKTIKDKVEERMKLNQAESNGEYFKRNLPYLAQTHTHKSQKSYNLVDK